MSLSSLLVQREVATMRQIEEALARQVLYGGDLVTNLLEVAPVDEARLAATAAEAAGLDAAPPGVLPSPEERARAAIPPDLAAKRSIYPLSFADDENLVVAVGEPLKPEDEEQLMFALGHPIVQRVAPMVRVRQALTREYGAPLERRHERLLQRLQGDPTAMSSSLPPLLRDAPPVAMPPRPRTFPPPTQAMVEALAGVVEVESTSKRAEPSDSDAPVRRKTKPFESVRPPPVAEVAEGGEGARGVEPSGPPPTPMSPTTDMPAPRDTVRPSLLRELPALSRPPRRRRGPIPFDQARAELDEAVDRDALLDLFFDFSRQYFDYAALFIVHGDVAEGRDAWGAGASRDRVLTLGVPLDVPSLLATTREMRAPMIEKPETVGIDAVFIEELGRRATADVIVVPLVVRNRVVAMLYGDSGDAGVDRNAVSDVTTFAVVAAQALERLILKKKLGTGPAPPSSFAVARKKPSLRPPQTEEAKAVRVEALGRAVMAPGARSSPPADVELHDRDHGEGDEGSEPAAPDTEATGAGDADAFAPPKKQAAAQAIAASAPPMELLVRRPSGPPIPREDPADATSRPPERVFPLVNPARTPTPPMPGLSPTPTVPTAPVHEGSRVPQPPPPLPRDLVAPSGASGASADDDFVPEPEAETQPEPVTDIDAGGTTLEELNPPPSQPTVPNAPTSEQMIAVPPRAPPPKHGAVEELPSVIVDVAGELQVLVERYVQNPNDEQAEAELLREGPQAMPAIMAHFPGPIVLEPRGTTEEVPQAAHCGPILRLIAAQRRVALPWVLEQCESRDENKRFWAAFLLGDLAYADAVASLVPRLFDRSERVRRAARWATAGVARHHGDEVAREIGRIVRDPTQHPARRLAMLEVLEEIREPLAVPTFISVLNDDLEEIALVARRALAIVTRQDFGRDAKRWTTWWNANSSRDRIEWLIDALSHEQQVVRRAAGEELKAITKEYFGYYDDLPKRDRERAQARYREWWNHEGRARFARG